MGRSLFLYICWFFLIPCLLSSSSFAEVSTIRIVEANPRPPNIYTYLEILDSQEKLVPGIEQDQITATMGSEFLEIDEFDRLSNSLTSISYVLLIDISRSIPQNQFDEIKDVFDVWVNSLNEQDRVAIFAFGQDIKLIQDFTSDKKLLIEVIDSLRLTDTTTRLYGAMINGIEYARSLEQNTDTHCVLVVLSDGDNDVVGGITRNEVITKINQYQIPIYGLGVFALPLTDTKDQHLKNFGELSRMSGGSFFSNAEQSFGEIFQSMNERIRNVYRVVLNSPSSLVDGNLYRMQLNLQHNGKVFTDSMDLRMYPVRAAVTGNEVSPIEDQSSAQNQTTADEPMQENQAGESDETDNHLGGSTLQLWDIIITLFAFAGLALVLLVIFWLIKNLRKQQHQLEPVTDTTDTLKPDIKHNDDELNESLVNHHEERAYDAENDFHEANEDGLSQSQTTETEDSEAEYLVDASVNSTPLTESPAETVEQAIETPETVLFTSQNQVDNLSETSSELDVDKQDNEPEEIKPVQPMVGNQALVGSAAHMESPGLYALENVDFSWTVNLDQLWEDSRYDVESINSEIRYSLTHQITRLTHHTETKSPLGWIVVGEGGAGKSHLLRELRKYSSNHAVGFIAVDLVGVRDFWDTVLLAYLNSMQKPYKDEDPQYKLIIKNLLQESGSSVDQEHYASRLADLSQGEIVHEIQNLLNLLNKKHKMEIAQYHDVIRALILFNSNDFAVSNFGFSWLQGLGIDEAHKKEFGFQAIQKEPIEIVKALSWLMHLRGPTVLVLDQMDAIVHKYHLASGIKSKKPLTDEQLRARSIIHSVAGGLADLVDSVSYRTMIVVSCLEATWRILFEETLSTYKGRFHLPPLTLKSLQNSESGYQLIKNRLNESYNQIGFIPPYPSWPYNPTAFETAKHMFPRELLIKCEEHRIRCVQSQKVEELERFSKTGKLAQSASDDPRLLHIDQLFAQEKEKADISGCLIEDLDDKEDTRLGLLLKTMCESLMEENPLPDSIDSEVEVDFPDSKSFPPLHVRIRLIFRDEGDQEKQLNFRALLRTSPIAFQNRIQAAMTASGVDLELPFRKLVVVTQDYDRTGQKTTEFIQKLKDTGSDLVVPNDDDLHTLIALRNLSKQKPDVWGHWLRHRKPASNLVFINQWVEWLFADLPAEDLEELVIQDSTPQQEKTTAEHAEWSQNFMRIGSMTNEEGFNEPLLINAGLLSNHMAILSGSGTNKPILLKRIIEQACLLNVPAIVIDHENFMTQLDDARDTFPIEWDESEIKLAEKYQQQKHVMVWTPGAEQGKPIALNHFPDFGVARENPENLSAAIEMAKTSIEENLLFNQLTQTKLRILSHTLENYAQNNNNGIFGYIDYLANLPEEAKRGIQREDDFARELAEQLSEKLKSENYPSNHAFDPAMLLGNQQTTDKTNISILNLNGFESVKEQQDFVNQLVITLFSTCLKVQGNQQHPLRALLIIDDAKNFIPSRYEIACKSNIAQFLKQAKSLGIGVIFATQEPRSVDLELINACKTHCYGRVNSPASENLIRENMEERWQENRDVARLDSNQFYLFAEDHPEPRLFSLSPCYSKHQNALTLDQIISKANQGTSTY